MKIYTITHAVYFSDDYDETVTERIHTWAMSYATQKDAREALQEDIVEMVGYAYDGKDDREAEEEAVARAVKSGHECGNICGRHDIREYELELDDRAVVWSIFEQEI